MHTEKSGSEAYESRWSKYLESESRYQKELADVLTAIEDATQIIVRWVLDNPRAGSGTIGWTSAEDNPDVLALQQRVGELTNIITRRTKGTHSPRDGEQWSATVAAVRSLLESKRLRRLLLRKADIAGGARYAGQIDLARLVDRLPKDLPGTAVAPRVTLTEREAKIWEVIQRGSTGLQYCRELDNAGIAPMRRGVWEDCPRKYASAYMEGEHWRHRIQDEKSKVRRKAELTGLASE